MTRVIHEAWPTSEEQRQQWFDSLGMTPERRLGDWECWGTGLPGWGDAEICWSCFGLEGNPREFTGIGWYLWGDESTAAATEELLGLITDQLGPATPRAGSSVPWHQWQVGERLVELGGSADDPRTQLHVVVAEFADDPHPCFGPEGEFEDAPA